MGGVAGHHEITLIGLTGNGELIEVEGDVFWCRLPVLTAHRGRQHYSLQARKRTFQREVGIRFDGVGSGIGIGFVGGGFGERDRDGGFVQTGQDDLVGGCAPVA